MAAEKVKASWVELDPTSLPSETRNAYDNYKAQYKAMKEVRECFERMMQTNAPEGKRLVFGYNFGKLSVAIVDDDRKPKAKGAVALADLLRRA